MSTVQWGRSIANDGVVCPYCQHEDHRATVDTVRADHYRYKVTCEKCKAIFQVERRVWNTITKYGGPPQ